MIDCIDHQRSTADQISGLDAPLKGMFYQTCADTSSRPFRVRRKLAEEKTGDRIGWLPGADRARQDCGNDGGRRQAVIPDDAPGLLERTAVKPSLDWKARAFLANDRVSACRWKIRKCHAPP